MEEMDVIIIKKILLARIYKYAMLKRLNILNKSNEKMDKVIARYERKGNVGYIYEFKNNFKNYTGLESICTYDEELSDIEEYKTEVADFIEKSFPYCFNVNLCGEEQFNALEKEKQLEASLKFFILSQYANDLSEIDEYNGISAELFDREIPFYLSSEYFYPEWGEIIDTNSVITELCKDKKIKSIQDIKSTLSSIKMNNFTNYIKCGISQDNPTQKVNIESICGSTVSGYRCDNLYDVLLRINDKRVERFIDYIMINGGVDGCGKIFEGVCIAKDQNGMLYVEEGNHRVFTCKALRELKSRITNERTEEIDIEAYTQQIIIKDRNNVDKNNRNDLEENER